MPWREPLARLWKLAIGCSGAVEPDDETIGAAWRPGLVDAHGLDPAALQRLEEAARRRERRRDPEVARDLAHHVLAVVVLEQHEFDEPVARREEREPGAAVRGRGKAGRIAGQLREQGLRLAAGAGKRDQPVPPALRDDQPFAAGIDQQAVGEGETAREAAAPVPPPRSIRQTEPPALPSMRSTTQSSGPCVAEP